jgi:phospholipase/carboxylesterase
MEPLRSLTRPAAAEPAGALVLLHGRGADEHDLFPLLDALDPERRLAGFTPRGPLSLPPGGAHWYVLGELGYPEPETFLASFAALGSWLDGLGFAPERTVIGGFSQGAVMSYALGLGEGRPRPAGIAAFSGFVPTVPGWSLDLEPPLPRVAIGHGSFDPVIGVEWGRQAKQLLEGAGADVLYGEAPIGHGIDPGFANQVREWLAEVLP